MKNIYYSVWSDAIINIGKNPDYKKDWKFFTMVFITLLNSLNFASVLLLLHVIFNIKIIWVRITLFPIDTLNSSIDFLFQFALPFIIINYLFIFYRNRYKKLILKFGDKKGKLFAKYLLVTIIILISTVAIGILNQRV